MTGMRHMCSTRIRHMCLTRIRHRTCKLTNTEPHTPGDTQTHTHTEPFGPALPGHIAPAVAARLAPACVQQDHAGFGSVFFTVAFCVFLLVHWVCIVTLSGHEFEGWTVSGGTLGSKLCFSGAVRGVQSSNFKWVRSILGHCCKSYTSMSRRAGRFGPTLLART